MKPGRLLLFAISVWIVWCGNPALLAQGSPNVPLLAHVNQYPAVGYNDCWGYTAPDGREYALLGVQNGTSIIDITDAPNNVTEIVFIPSANSLWKDIKTYQHYAYVVNESGGGLQIIDLSDLPNTATLAGAYTGFSTSHNIYIDVPGALLFAEGSFSDPVRIISLADPLNPVQLSTFGIECHDMYAQDNVVYVAEGGSGSIGIYSYSNPSSPSLINRVPVPVAGYVHNTWASADGNYLMSTEETNGKTIKLWDISNLGNVTLTDQILGPSGLPHNTHVKGNFAYVSHYADGLRIYDLSDPYDIFEAGYYDTYAPPSSGFDGAWGAFPFFASGKVLISDIQSGLYVVFFAGAAEGDPLDPNPPANISAYSDYTTPTSIALNWDDPATLFNGTPLSPAEFTVEILRDGAPVASVPGGAQQYTDGGLSDGQLYEYTLYAKLIANDSTSQAKTVSWHAGGSPFPSAPENLACAATASSAILTWDDPATQADGTPLDDLDHINVYRNGNLVGSAGPGVQTYTDNPPPGFVYTYTVTAVDNEAPPNESAPSGAASSFVGSTPSFLVWVGPGALGASAASGDSILAALAANGVSAFLSNDLFEFGADLSVYAGIFVVLGIFPDNHVIAAADPEGAALQAYLQNGGRLYLEGGDCFNYDPEVGGYAIRPWFGLNDGNDGSGDVSGISGLNQLSPFSFAYNGDNNWMDELAPAGSNSIWKNSANNDLSGVFHAGFGSGKSIGVVPSFGGLVDNPAPLRPLAGTSNRLEKAAEKAYSAPERTESGGAKPSRAELRARLAQQRGETAGCKPAELERRPFVKKAAYYPERAVARSSGQPLYRHTSHGLEILANTKADLMLAYLDLLGYQPAPQIATAPGFLNFDTLAVGQQAVKTLQVFNQGAGVLEVSAINSPHPYFSAGPGQFAVPAGGSQAVQVTFAPASPGFYSGVLKIASNDPAQDTLEVAVEGYADQGVGIGGEPATPAEFALAQNYPNPFNPETAIRFQLPSAREVELAIYNTLGQKVRTLASGSMPPGYYRAVWDGRNQAGESVGSGVYICIFEAGDFRQVRKMILLR
ncbi:MAG: choice-of-anchor B family protein [Calditrichaceae bacterium]|nr:choice-of-anchor B family protein [Calditrichia bacterium]NUQ42129.1 choice-of-anchor B family protein [Calditrichaceae bacterium]